MAGIKIDAIGRTAPHVGGEFIVSVSGQGTTGKVPLFTAPAGRRFAVIKFGGRWSTATSVGGGTVSLERVATGVAAGSGTNIATTELAADATANGLVYGVVDDTEGSSGKNIIEPGESLMTIYTGNTGTLTALAGAHFFAVIREVPPLKGT